MNQSGRACDLEELIVNLQRSTDNIASNQQTQNRYIGAPEGVSITDTGESIGTGGPPYYVMGATTGIDAFESTAFDSDAFETTLVPSGGGGGSNPHFPYYQKIVCGFWTAS